MSEMKGAALFATLIVACVLVGVPLSIAVIWAAGVALSWMDLPSWVAVGVIGGALLWCALFLVGVMFAFPTEDGT
jgi:ABC-type arginine/histidine transport system permease subunit